MSKGFPYKVQLEELLFTVMVYCMYSQHITLSSFSFISLFLTATYFSNAQYSRFVLKVPLNPNQSTISELISFLLCYVLLITSSCCERLWLQVKKLVHENRLLRCGYSPVDIPPSVNGPGVPKNEGVSCGRPARWSLVESSDLRRHVAVRAFFSAMLSARFRHLLLNLFVDTLCIFSTGKV